MIKRVAHLFTTCCQNCVHTCMCAWLVCYLHFDRKSKDDTWVSTNTYWELRKDPGFTRIDCPVLWWHLTHNPATPSLWIKAASWYRLSSPSPFLTRGRNTQLTLDQHLWGMSPYSGQGDPSQNMNFLCRVAAEQYCFTDELDMVFLKLPFSILSLSTCLSFQCSPLHCLFVIFYTVTVIPVFRSDAVLPPKCLHVYYCNITCARRCKHTLTLGEFIKCLGALLWCRCDVTPQLSLLISAQ